MRNPLNFALKETPSASPTGPRLVSNAARRKETPTQSHEEIRSNPARDLRVRKDALTEQDAQRARQPRDLRKRT